MCGTSTVSLINVFPVEKPQAMMTLLLKLWWYAHLWLLTFHVRYNTQRCNYIISVARSKDLVDLLEEAGCLPLHCGALQSYKCLSGKLIPPLCGQTTGLTSQQTRTHHCLYLLTGDNGQWFRLSVVSCNGRTGRKWSASVEFASGVMGSSC